MDLFHDKFKNIISISKNSYQYLQIVSIIAVIISNSALAQWNTQSPIPTFLDVRGIGAPTTQHVFLATDDNSFDTGGSLFESKDGGVTWMQLNIPFSLNDPFNGLFFLNNQYGWAYGNDNYRTSDGGTTWSQHTQFALYGIKG